MKLILKKDKEFQLRIIRLLNIMLRAEQGLFSLTQPYKRYPEKDFRGLYDYENILDMIYLEFVGKSEDEVYDAFASPSSFDETKPVAWYDKEGFNPTHRRSLKLPKFFKDEYGGYIPDKINNTILDRNLLAKEKHRVLSRCFKDLVKIQKAWEKEKCLK